MEDMISRQALCEYALNQKDKSITPNDIMRFPSAQSTMGQVFDGDTINRQAAIEAVDKNRDTVFHNSVDYEGVLYDINNLPSAQPETHEERTETHACDLISRQAAIDMLKNRWKKTRNYEGIGDDIAEECELYLKQVPSAQPDSKELSFTHKALDTISRQAVIELIQGSICDLEYSDENSELCNKVRALPLSPSRSNWIPCSKALPKIGNRVIGTYKNSLFKNGPYVVRIMRREKKYWVGDDEHWFLYENILAWQPLPEPYREEGD